MDHLMVLMIAILRDHFLLTHWGLLVVKCLALIRASNWDHMMVK